MAFWGIGLKRGTMLGHEPIVGMPFSSRLWIRREAHPVGFWLFAVLYGVIAVAVLLVAIVRWVTGS